MGELVIRNYEPLRVKKIGSKSFTSKIEQLLRKKKHCDLELWYAKHPIWLLEK